VLVQRRYTICTKYGNSPQKSYMLIERKSRKIKVWNVDGLKSLVVKRSKGGAKFGTLVKMARELVTSD